MTSSRKRVKEKMILDFFNNKKGTAIVDGIVIVVILCVVAIIFGISGYIMDEVEGSIQSEITDATANESLHEFADNTPSALDGAFAMFLVLFWLGAIILSFMIDTHPIFFVFTIILLVIVFVVGGYLSNFYDEVDSEFNFEDNYPMMSYIMDHLLHFVIGIVFSIVISLFAKSQMG